MSGIDWLLLAILAVSSLLGLMRGFIGIIASFAAWLLGGITALALGGDVAQMVAAPYAPGPVQMLIGYGACFLGVSISVAVCAYVARRALIAAGLGRMDSALGLAVGGLRGVLMGCAIVLLLGFTPIPRQPQWRESALVPLFKPGARWMATLLPEWAQRRLDLDGRRPPGKPFRLPTLPALPA